jgi:hypothetical protein
MKFFFPSSFSTIEQYFPYAFNEEEPKRELDVCIMKILIEKNNSENYKTLITYIINSNIVSPILLNIMPALAIFIMNLILWVFIRRYLSRTQLTEGGSQIHHNNSTASRSMARMQKSYYLTIMLGVWL